MGGRERDRSTYGIFDANRLIPPNCLQKNKKPTPVKREKKVTEEAEEPNGKRAECWPTKEHEITGGVMCIYLHNIRRQLRGH